MQSEKRYDVFLSHNSAGKPAVEYLSQRLRQEGLEPAFELLEGYVGEEIGG